jgi:predicted nucleic acid-binding protein
MIVVSDTSPITNLALVGQLILLQQLYGIVVIPQAVAEEIAAVIPRLTNTPDMLHFDDLIAKAGFWISHELYDRVLQAAGE